MEMWGRGIALSKSEKCFYLFVAPLQKERHADYCTLQQFPPKFGYKKNGSDWDRVLRHFDNRRMRQSGSQAVRHWDSTVQWGSGVVRE
jgi:hypothetical protein